MLKLLGAVAICNMGSSAPKELRMCFNIPKTQQGGLEFWEGFH